MPFTYSCFISYPCLPGPMATFMSRFVPKLEGEIQTYIRRPVFFDEKRITGGDNIAPLLAHALCRSVCMVMVYAPVYFDEEHPYCTQEFVAMEQLEQQRLRILGQSRQHAEWSFIIPVILRGPECLPQELSGRRCFDFSQYSLKSLNVLNAFENQVKDIARRVGELHKLLKNVDPCGNCQEFTLPTPADVLPRLMQLQAPMAPFPGRAA